MLEASYFQNSTISSHRYMYIFLYKRKAKSIPYHCWIEHSLWYGIEDCGTVILNSDKLLLESHSLRLPAEETTCQTRMLVSNKCASRVREG